MLVNKELIEYMLDVFGLAQTIIFCEMKSYEYRLSLYSRDPGILAEEDIYYMEWFEKESNKLKEEFLENMRNTF